MALADEKPRIPRCVIKHFGQVGNDLSPQARAVYSFIATKGSITSQEAGRSAQLAGINSGALTARMSDLRKAGFKIGKEVSDDPITGRKYTRYYFRSMDDASQ